MDWLFAPLFADNAPWIIALVGAAIGSFLSLITYRFIHEQPMLGARSRCVACGTTLGLRDLVPVVSWLCLRGTARCCGARISPRYPLIELVCALGATALVTCFGWHPITLVYVFMFWCVAGLMLADLESYFLPDVLMLPLGLLGVYHAYLLEWDDALVIGAAASGWLGALALHYGGAWLLKRPALGLGDVKLFGVAGIWLGDGMLLVPYIFFAGILGIVLAIAWRASGRGSVFPFGPALLIALMACVYYPQSVSLFWQLYQ